MNRKLIAVVALIALVASGAFAELMIGVSGALHMDEQLTANEIQARFEDGEGIFYGPFLEIAGKHLGFGVAGNFSFYDLGIGAMTYAMMDYDIVGYMSYHLFGSHFILDPFAELGGGYIATDFANDADKTQYNPYKDAPMYASLYWYGALGVGVNLGPLGIFGKFAYNYPINKDFEAEWNPDSPASGGMSGSTTLYPYGYDPVLFDKGYLPKFRVTVGAKLIL